MRCVLLLACGLTFAATPIPAQIAPTLVGLRGVEVRVVIKWSDMPTGAVSEAGLQTDIELELRRVGIPVLSREEWSRTPGRPLLVLDLVCVTDAPGSSCAIMLALMERATLERDARIAQPAMTWTTDVGVLTVGRDGGGGFMREKVRERARQFANDFLAANPRR